jgi:hypothetical protein
LNRTEERAHRFTIRLARSKRAGAAAFFNGIGQKRSPAAKASSAGCNRLLTALASELPTETIAQE